jgi:hypothetical protein
MLLASHPDVASVGETSAIEWKGEGDTGLCSCGEPLVQCAFWRDVGRALRDRGFDWTSDAFQTEFRMKSHAWPDRLLRAEYRGVCLELLRDALLGLHPGWRAAAPSILAANAALCEVVTELSGARVFVDSSKEPHRLKYMLRIPSLRTKVIHLVRDGRGVCASYVRKGLPVDSAADEWRRSIVSEEHILRRLRPEQIVRVHYEDMCRDVHGVLGRLFRFMGVDDAWRPNQGNGKKLHILGNRLRMKPIDEIREDDRWRTALSADDLATFGKRAGAVNERYGYAANGQV